MTRLPDGLIRPGPPAAPEVVAAAEQELGVALPQPLRDFLLSFDGADLFHESIVIAGVGPDAALSLLSLNPRANRTAETGAAELVFAETVLGDRFAFAESGAVLRLRAGSDERTLSGSTFERWLAAMVARRRCCTAPTASSRRMRSSPTVRRSRREQRSVRLSGRCGRIPGRPRPSTNGEPRCGASGANVKRSTR